MGPELRVYVFMGLALLAGLLLGWLILRNGWLRAYGALLAGHVLAALGLFLAARQGQQMEGLGYAILLAVFVLPATLGFCLGGGAAWWAGRRSIKS